MKKTKWILLVPAVALLLAALLMAPLTAYAQSYLFSLDALYVDVFLNEDGSTSVLYEFNFTNAPTGHNIEYVDVGMPNGNFSMNGATAEVNGNPVSLSRSEYAGDGSGFAVVLGREAILAGRQGTVRVFIPNAGTWLERDTEADDYASFVFSPTWFGREYVQGSTDTRVTIHFPPGVKPEEPRWHQAPPGFPSEPETGIDDQGRIYYSWNNTQSSATREYEFGVSFPAQYVPESAIRNPSIFEALGISGDTLFTFACCGSIGLFIVGISMLTNRAQQQRKLQYLPPKVAIEGLGIKRGLTAVEAAILMEQPLDKVMTMILFGVVKKNAAEVTSKDPLEVRAVAPQPDGLYEYEKEFLGAFEKPKGAERRKALQDMTIALVKSVQNKMKGFSSKETVAYYRDIMERAWKQVEAAQTPEVKSEAFDKVMEWTMLDKDYDDRTRRVFTGPVFVPTWYPRYDPTYRPSPSTTSIPTGQSGGGGGGGFSLPTLPGSAFAASVIGGVQDFSSNVMGDLTSFTSGVTKTTNPPPVPTASTYRGGGGGGRSCACACACAGCACACAGGGR